MPEFFLELFSEEIPARMQRDAGIQLADICTECLSLQKFKYEKVFTGPRHVAILGHVDANSGGGGFEEIRGPRETAPDAAISGFLRKHGIEREQLSLQNGFYILRKDISIKSARESIQTELAQALSRFYWPKSMRWGQSGDFNWVRPLRRIVCLLDSDVVPITLGPVTASNLTEGHRFLGPEVFAILSGGDWEGKLRRHFVIADHEERRNKIIQHLSEVASSLGLSVAYDEQLVNEVVGLVEWPVVLTGKIEPEFMELPPEVRELSMKVNQRYFALRGADGNPAPTFAFVSNVEAKDGGKSVVAGNERVLRARLSDARHFWDLDLKTPLDALLPKLEKITFHAKLGNQLDRSERIAVLSANIAADLGASDLLVDQAEWAGRLSKCDLVTGVVGEFPELQGIVGGYYAEINPSRWEGKVVGPAIKTHYQPKGPSDGVPKGTIQISVALADKIDTLVGFHLIGEEATGSRDPFALRRCALGIIRIIQENNLTLNLLSILAESENLYRKDGVQPTSGATSFRVLFFIAERLRLQLKDIGARHDLLSAVFQAGQDDDLNFLIQRTHALEKFLQTEAGQNLLTAYKRTANVLPKGDEAWGSPDPRKFSQPQEQELFDQINIIREKLPYWFGENRQIGEAMEAFAKLRTPVDVFFDKVTVNAPEPELRRNRFRLLAQLRDTMHQIADFSKIEG